MTYSKYLLLITKDHPQSHLLIHEYHLLMTLLHHLVLIFLNYLYISHIDLQS